MPALDQRLRTIPERAARAIGGKSSGGFGALVLAMRHPRPVRGRRQPRRRHGVRAVAVARPAGRGAHPAAAWGDRAIFGRLRVARKEVRRRVHHHDGAGHCRRLFARRRPRARDRAAVRPRDRRDRLGRLGAVESLGSRRAGGSPRRGAAPDEAGVPRRGDARRAQPGPGRAHLGAPSAGAGRRLRARRVRRRPPLDRLPLRHLASQAGRRHRGGPDRHAGRRQGCAHLRGPRRRRRGNRRRGGDHAARAGCAAGGAVEAQRGSRVAARAHGLGPHWSGSSRRRPIAEDPVCPGFGRCGGCAIQHLGYAAQLDWKRARVLRAFATHAALRDVAVAAAVASPRVLGYRNNAKLVAARRGRATILGGYAPRTHEVVDLLGCRVVEPALDAVATELRALVDELDIEVYDERKLTGRLRYVVLRSNHAGQVLCAFIVARALPNGRELADRLRAARPEVVGVVEHENRTRGNAIFAAGSHDADRHAVRRAGPGRSIDRRGADDPDPADGGRILPGEPRGGGTGVRGADSGAGPAADGAGGGRLFGRGRDWPRAGRARSRGGRHRIERRRRPERHGRRRPQRRPQRALSGR